jgi:hypothetical protein
MNQVLLLPSLVARPRTETEGLRCGCRDWPKRGRKRASGAQKSQNLR